MRMMVSGLVSGCMMIVSSTWGYADDASKQIQMLNSQLQVQLQRLQETQQKQVQKLNTQLQAQLKEVQTKLQDEMKKMNTMTQTKMKKMQEDLQSQIKQLHEDMLTGGAMAAPEPEKKKADTPKPSKAAKADAPVGLQ